MGNIHIGGLVSHLLDGPDHRIGKVIFPSNGSHHEPRNAESKGGNISVDIAVTKYVLYLDVTGLSKSDIQWKRTCR
ncbi:hypothetical protein Tco_0388224 [Tanacetum coccineum]